MQLKYQIHKIHTVHPCIRKNQQKCEIFHECLQVCKIPYIVYHSHEVNVKQFLRSQLQLSSVYMLSVMIETCDCTVNILASIYFYVSQKQGHLSLLKQDWLCSCVYCIKYRFAVIRSSLFSLELKTSSCLISLYSDYTDTTSFPHTDTELNIHPRSHDTFTTSCEVSISQVLLLSQDPMNITWLTPLHPLKEYVQISVDANEFSLLLCDITIRLSFNPIF